MVKFSKSSSFNVAFLAMFRLSLQYDILLVQDKTNQLKNCRLIPAIICIEFQRTLISISSALDLLTDVLPYAYSLSLSGKSYSIDTNRCFIYVIATRIPSFLIFGHQSGFFRTGTYTHLNLYAPISMYIYI